jgi:tRNA (mo5U34)-methyltransferase
VIDETGETQEPESGLTGISLCPSLDALRWVMQKVGFSRVETVPAPHGAYEQHASGSRVIVAGFAD